MKRSVSLAFVTLSLSCAVSQAQLREVWAVSLPSINPAISKLIAAKDGALYLVGSNSGATVMLAACLESDGALRWQRILNMGGSEALTSADLLHDNSLIVGGSYSGAAGVVRTVALRFTQSGDLTSSFTDEGYWGITDVYVIDASDVILTAHGGALNRLLAVRLNEGLGLLRRRLTVLSGNQTFRPSIHNLATDDRAFHFAKVRTSVGDEARLFALDDQLVPLYQLPFDPGSLDGGPTGIAAITPTEPAVAWYSDVGTGLYEHVARVNGIGQVAWHESYYSGSSLLVGNKPMWFDQGGLLMVSRLDPLLGQVVLQFDPSDGRTTGFLQMPLPADFDRGGYGTFVVDERGAHYAIGNATNWASGGGEEDVHFLVLKLDRNLRPVWMQTLYYDEAFAGRTAYHNGHLHIAGSKNSPTGPPPIVKLKILAVRSEGDLNEDGCIDDTDLAIVLKTFGTSDPWGDANDDGIVDDLDLAEVLHNFGLGCG